MALGQHLATHTHTCCTPLHSDALFLIQETVDRLPQTDLTPTHMHKHIHVCIHTHVHIMPSPSFRKPWTCYPGQIPGLCEAESMSPWWGSLLLLILSEALILLLRCLHIQPDLPLHNKRTLGKCPTGSLEHTRCQHSQIQEVGTASRWGRCSAHWLITAAGRSLFSPSVALTYKSINKSLLP